MEKKTDNIDILEEKEKKAIEEFKKLKDYKQTYYGYSWFTVEVCADDEMKQNIDIILNIIEKQSKEIEELKETLKCTQNSWFEDTQKIEEMKKQLDLDNECEIALNNKIMDLEKEIEELKENYIRLQNTEAIQDIYIKKDKIKAKIEEYKKQIEKMEKDDVGIGFTLGKEWSDLKAKIEFGQSLLEKE